MVLNNIDSYLCLMKEGYNQQIICDYQVLLYRLNLIGYKTNRLLYRPQELFQITMEPLYRVYLSLDLPKQSLTNHRQLIAVFRTQKETLQFYTMRDTLNVAKEIIKQNERT